MTEECSLRDLRVPPANLNPGPKSKIETRKFPCPLPPPPAPPPPPLPPPRPPPPPRSAANTASFQRSSSLCKPRDELSGLVELSEEQGKRSAGEEERGRGGVAASIVLASLHLSFSFGCNSDGPGRVTLFFSLLYGLFESLSPFTCLIDNNYWGNELFLTV